MASKGRAAIEQALGIDERGDRLGRLRMAATVPVIVVGKFEMGAVLFPIGGERGAQIQERNAVTRGELGGQPVELGGTALAHPTLTFGR